MTENNLQLQIKRQKRIKIILFILRIFLMLNAVGAIFLATLLLVVSRKEHLILAIIILIASFLFFQWSTSYRILSFSSVQFMRKNKALLFIYNILTLNILGLILTSKFLKNDNYNYINLIEKDTFYNTQIYNNKPAYFLNEILYFRRRMTMILSCLSIIYTFSYIWSYKYMKYLDENKIEWINVQAYNRMLFDVDFLIYLFGKRKKS